MDLIRKGRVHSHRGIIGIESAIVLIAFVIVAAALAFVVLNMGFSTTQKAKTTIVQTLSEAASSLEISGKVIASGHIVDNRLNATAIPLKIASGGDSVNLEPTLTAVKYISNTVTYDDILSQTPISVNTATSLRGAVNQADADGIISTSPYPPAQGGDGISPNDTTAFIYWSVNDNNNRILDQGEHAVLAIVWHVNDRPGPLDKIRAELIVSSGASLTVERQIPNITSEVVDLG